MKRKPKASFANYFHQVYTIAPYGVIFLLALGAAFGDMGLQALTYTDTKHVYVYAWLGRLVLVLTVIYLGKAIAQFINRKP